MAAVTKKPNIVFVLCDNAAGAISGSTEGARQPLASTSSPARASVSTTLPTPEEVAQYPNIKTGEEFTGYA